MTHNIQLYSFAIVESYTNLYSVKEQTLFQIIALIAPKVT